MKKLSFSVLFYLIPGLLIFSAAQSFCQTLTGYVYDEKKNPLMGASVYLNGTTIGTITDNKGFYTLIFENNIYSSLVISFIGYQTQIIDNPFEKPDRQIYLAQKIIELKEVSVSTHPLSREQKLKLFREKFLGTTIAGKSCIIENEDDIIFNYDLASNTLFAASDKPIIILNPYLGYSINYNLTSFSIKFNGRSIKSKNVTGISWSGKYLFTDVGNNDKMIFKRREDVYLGSVKHFFRNLSNNTWGENEFLLLKDKTPVKPDDYFIISDSLGIKKITVLKNISENGAEPFFSDFKVIYNNIEQFNISFRTRTFIIDEYGNNSFGLIHFSGERARIRVGELLPMDFKLNN